MKINFEVTDTDTDRVISRTFTGFCQAGLIASMKNFILHVSDTDRCLLFRIKQGKTVIEFTVRELASLKKKKK